MTGKPIKDARRTQLLEILAGFCDRGERAPTLDHLRYLGVKNASQIGTMAHEGILRVEITDKNYRTIWICQGPHAGKHTLLPAADRNGRRPKPYVVIGPTPPVRAQVEAAQRASLSGIDQSGSQPDG